GHLGGDRVAVGAGPAPGLPLVPPHQPDEVIQVPDVWAGGRVSGRQARSGGGAGHAGQSANPPPRPGPEPALTRVGRRPPRAGPPARPRGPWSTRWPGRPTRVGSPHAADAPRRGGPGPRAG